MARLRTIVTAQLIGRPRAGWAPAFSQSLTLDDLRFLFSE